MDNTKETTIMPLGGPDEVMIFFREGGWYPVQGCLGKPLAAQAADHAGFNPETVRIEDIDGNVLWRRLQ